MADRQTYTITYNVPSRDFDDGTVTVFISDETYHLRLPQELLNGELNVLRWDVGEGREILIKRDVDE